MAFGDAAARARARAAEATFHRGEAQLTCARSVSKKYLGVGKHESRTWDEQISHAATCGAGCAVRVAAGAPQPVADSGCEAVILHTHIAVHVVPKFDG